MIRVENNEDILVEAMNFSRNKVMEITIKDLDAILANRVYPLNETLSKNYVLISLRTLNRYNNKREYKCCYDCIRRKNMSIN